jgi:RNAse (barnase) inhibitor barstar
MNTYALFSNTGRFIGFTNFKPSNGLYKQMPSNFDPVQQVYVGDYKTGELKNIQDLQLKDYREANIDKKWKVFESELNRELARTIVRDHGLQFHKQMNAVMEVIYENRDKLKLTPEFERVFKIISDLRHNHNKSLEVYKQAPKADVITSDKELEFVEEYTQKQLNINE